MSVRLPITLLLLILPLAAGAAPTVDPLLLKTLDAGQTATALVYLDARADLSRATEMDWQARGRYVSAHLRQVAERSQAPVREILDRAGMGYQSFWIANVIVVAQTDRQTLDRLVALPGVRAVRGESGSRLMAARGEPGPEAISNIAHIGAPEVWAQGFTGQGMTVGIIDSGARHTHEALLGRYRGRGDDGTFEHDYHWFDPGGSPEPAAPHPHGTHVAGTAVGDGGPERRIGVAPGAQWMACLGCPGDQCPDAHLLACAEFMLAPHDLEGENPNPDLRPHVVNNSWGDCRDHYDDWFQPVVDAWIAAGIAPVFSNGNATACNYSRPPGLNTVGNPARYGNVLGIGSTGNSDGEYANHSNQGPTDNPSPGLPDAPDHFGFARIKPNVAAPGVNIFSSIASADDAYQAGWTGTSMSAPHAAGTLALMWSAAQCLERDYPATGTLLMQTARPIAFDSGGEPPPGPDHVPNYATGWGEIDALAAVEAAVRYCTPGFDLTAPEQPVSLCAGDTAELELGIASRQDFGDAVTLALSGGLPPGATAHFSPNPVTPDDPAALSVLTVTDTSDAENGDYILDITGVTGGPDFEPITETVQAMLQLVRDRPDAGRLLSPANGAGDQPLAPVFTWQPQVHAAHYRFELSASPDFQDLLIDQVIEETTFTPAAELEPARQYYWRIAAVNACGQSDWSRVFRLTTAPPPGQCPLGTEAATVFFEDFGQGRVPATWQADSVPAESTWVISDSHSYQAGFAAHAAGVAQPADQRLTTPEIALPANARRLLLNFHTWQDIEAGAGQCFDGALVEISTDGGNGPGDHWTQPGPERILARPYDGPVAADFLNPLAGRPAWCGNPRDLWERYSVDLSPQAGRTLRLRFRFGTDNSIATAGWYIDAVEIKACFDVFSDRFEAH